MNIKFIICIIIGIILYILINKIEGLTCRGPLDVALGNPNPELRLDRLNRGSLPFFPKNNIMVARRVDGRYITETSQNAPWSNNDSLTLICSQGLKDESQEKLAPYTPLTIEGNNLTCHRPSKKAIFYRIHGDIVTDMRDPLIRGSINSGFTQIPKKMQLIFYINNGDCHSYAALISIRKIHNLFSGIYNEVDISIPARNLLIQPRLGENSLFDKGFSELESINGIYMLSIDGNNVLIELKTPRRPDETDFVVFNLSQGNVYSMTYNAASFSNQNIPQIFRKLYSFRNTNLLKSIGPYSGTFPIIDFSDNDDRLGNIIDTYPNLFGLVNYVRVETTDEPESDELQTITFTYNIERMEGLKDLIKELISSQSVSVSISYLSPTFQSSDSFRRLFNGNDEIELPIFCLSILSHPYFVNPIGTTYALPGGQYTAQDLIDLIFDIIGQITSDHDSAVKSVYYRNMRSLGMSDDEIDTFFSQCNFLYTQTDILYSIPEDYPLLPFMNLWKHWNYPTTDTRDHTIYKWSMQTFLLLIQLFKQDEGEAIDVHSFTCLSGIGDERTTNNAKMDYSWQYAYSDEEANSLDKRIGLDCQRPVCPQSEVVINSKLVELGKGDFIVDSESFSRENRHPKSKQIIYTKNDDQGREITIDRSYIEPTGITVKCKDRPEITEKLICKYNEAYVRNKLNYNQSILELDPSRCNGQSILDINVQGPSLLSLSQSRVTSVSSVCGVALKFDHF